MLDSCICNGSMGEDVGNAIKGDWDKVRGGRDRPDQSINDARGGAREDAFCRATDAGRCRPARNRSPPSSGGSTQVLPYPRCSSSYAFSPPPPPPAAAFRARIISDSATPPAIRGSGIPQRYASVPLLVCPFRNGIVFPTPLLLSHPTCTRTTRRPSPPPRSSFFRQVLGNIKRSWA
jgi:hypothetical protein